MARGKVKISWIVNQKARQAAYKKRMQGLMKKANELTILCNVAACLMFYSSDDKKVVTWPSDEEAKALFDKYFSLPPRERNAKASDQESFINENIKKIEKKLAETRKVIMEYEMDDLMFQLQVGRPLDDLTDSEVDKLITYSNDKIVSLSRALDYRKHCIPRSVNEPSPLRDETPRPSNVESQLGGISSDAMGSGTIYYMDRWLPLDETPLPQMVSSFNLSEPSGEEDVATTKWYPGECSKSGGANDDA
ncbi:unnamed protein product [Arabis nemorensis]|uniref:MADS-box domain-containing protein n=1 Tax=Arabis nemorensis TaxID=586526 RepID=A0A565CII7_9BRAS|nr:unnamed protein product [Arabis nemorensis]